jgi:hypothetical protein
VRPQRIEVEIEELVLHGVGGAPVADALREELARVAAGGPWIFGAQRRERDDLRLEVESCSDPATFGRRLARAIYGGIDR